MKNRKDRNALLSMIASGGFFVMGSFVSCAGDDAGQTTIRRTVSPQVIPKDNNAPNGAKPKSNVVSYRTHDPVMI